MSVVSEWSDLPLDPRILEALKDLKWQQPTAVQSTSVPLALKGRDLSIHSRTGSGKTGAFVIPVIQRILAEREQKGAKSHLNPVALILVPSMELCEQTVESTNAIAKFIKPRIVVDNLTTRGAVTSNRVKAAHILVCTVALLAKYCRTGAVTSGTLSCLRYMVMDEADIVVSSAEHSLRTVQSVLPPNMQVILSSATLTDGVATVKGQLLHNPTNIVLTAENVSESTAAKDNGPLVESRIVVKEGKKDTLKQFYLVSSDECHHYTLLYSLYRFALISGKTLIFVEEDEQTYKLQHFLESMGVATLAYDASLPINVRLDTLRRFQSGAVSTLVCTDGTLESAERLCGQLQEEGVQEKGGKKKRARNESEEEAPSALHRGIDFSNVKNVILFNGVDASSSTELSRYTHRVGRTGRAGAEGLSITFFSVPQARRNLSEMRSYCESKGTRFRPFKKLQRAKAAKLQYRVDSVLSNVTRNATRKLRVATVAAELNRSSYLSQHMSQRDTDALRKIVNRSKGKVKIESNVLDVPEYMKLNVDEVKDFTRRVRADQTRSSKFKRAMKKTSEDPLKAVAAKIRAQRKKK